MCATDEWSLNIARFTTLCDVTANTSKITRTLLPQTAPDGSAYYEMEYDVILLFGLTELKAQISWVHQVGPVTVLNKPYHSRIVQGVEKR